MCKVATIRKTETHKAVLRLDESGESCKAKRIKSVTNGSFIMKEGYFAVCGGRSEE
jgi:hypothetical protein